MSDIETPREPSPLDGMAADDRTLLIVDDDQTLCQRLARAMGAFLGCEPGLRRRPRG